jgi:hypothetical protein
VRLRLTFEVVDDDSKARVVETVAEFPRRVSGSEHDQLLRRAFAAVRSAVTRPAPPETVRPGGQYL